MTQFVCQGGCKDDKSQIRLESHQWSHDRGSDRSHGKALWLYSSVTSHQGIKWSDQNVLCLILAALLKTDAKEIRMGTGRGRLWYWGRVKQRLGKGQWPEVIVTESEQGAWVLDRPCGKSQKALLWDWLWRQKGVQASCPKRWVHYQPFSDGRSWEAPVPPSVVRSLLYPH